MVGLFLSKREGYKGTPNKVDEANVDNYVESSSWWIQALEVWVGYQLLIMTKESEIFDEQSFDLG